MPTKPKMEDVIPPEEANPLLDSARKVLMAAIGAVALAQDEIEAFINRLIERGEIAGNGGLSIPDYRFLMWLNRVTQKTTVILDFWIGAEPIFWFW